MVELDRLKTTFRTEIGTFSFKRMPFGLINVDATFQRVMEIIFHGIIGQIVFVYLDYNTVFSKRISDHLRHLKQVFE